MTQNWGKTGIRFSFLALLSLIVCTQSGCQMYDWLVEWIQKSFVASEEYDVSVVDCKHFTPDDTFEVTSKLSERINQGIRQGVLDVGQNQKFRNLKLANKIPSNVFVQFQNDVFDEKGKYEDRTAALRKYCQTYKTNIIVWGATMGDDYNIAFIGWMYRRDLDTISTTNALPLEKKVSDRVQEKMIQDAMKNLLEKSLGEDPTGGTVGGVTNDLIENKESIIATATAALIYILQSSGQ